LCQTTLSTLLQLCETLIEALILCETFDYHQDHII
jgi:hypothetical protein